MSQEVEDFDDARNIGMSPIQAARWAAYLKVMRKAGKEPIGLDEAYLKIKAAEDRARRIHPRPPKRRGLGADFAIVDERKG